jgi:hypothetical protein
MLFSCVMISCRWLSLKEIDGDYIKYWKREIPRLMCEMQKYIAPTFFNAQEHYLIHQVEEIEICGPVHTRLMWMVERHLKSLKDLVRQRAHPKGYTVEGYMVYQSMVYISQCLPKLATPTMHAMDRIWDVNSIKNIKDQEHTLGKGRMKKMRGNILIIVEIYMNTYEFFFVYDHTD